MNVVLLICTTPSSADSYYSSQGLGIPSYYISAQAVGMGGAGIGVRQYLALNELNPGACDLKGFSSVAVGFQGEYVTHFIGDHSQSSISANAAGFRFAVPIAKQRFALLVALKPKVNSELSMEFENFSDQFQAIRTLNSKGGLNTASIGGNFAITKKLAVGLMMDFNFGAYRETWVTDFDDDTYLSSSDEITSHLWGKGLQLGLFAQPASFLSLGAVLSTSSSLKGETTTRTKSGKEIDPLRQDMNYPLSAGVGAALTLPKFLMAVDFYMQDWDQFEIDGKNAENVGDFWRLSLGGEYLDSKEYLTTYSRRIAYRIGASYAKLPAVDQYGEQTAEILGSVGFGFPFNKNAGRLDLAFEVGKRSSSPLFLYSENLYRLSISITNAEKWFQRSF